MEQVVIHKKLLFTIVGLCLFSLVIISTLYTFRKPRYALYACVDSDVATYIIESPDSYFDVYSGNSAKNVLWCLGKYLPFFERSLRSLHVKNQTIHDEISLRYKIQSTSTISPANNEWSIDRDHISVIMDEVHILAYFRPITSPFTALQQITTDKPTLFISPLNKTEIRSLIEGNGEKEIQFEEVENGSRYSYDLLR